MEMRIKICKECNYPVEQCQCSIERKQEWENIRTQELISKVQSIERDIVWTKQQLATRDTVLQNLQQDIDVLCYERQNSFEIDDDIADVIFALWEKGYNTRYCCSGHPERLYYGLYISFAQDYYFNFTTFPFEEGWEYTRYSGHCLRFSMTNKLARQLSGNGIDLTGYFLHQREQLKKWVDQLPPARSAERYESLPGIKTGSGKILPCNS